MPPAIEPYSIRFDFKRDQGSPTRAFFVLQRWIEAFELAVDDLGRCVNPNLRLRISLVDVKAQSIRPLITVKGLLEGKDADQDLTHEQLELLSVQANGLFEDLVSTVAKRIEFSELENNANEILRETRERIGISYGPVGELPTLEDMVQVLEPAKPKAPKLPSIHYDKLGIAIKKMSCAKEAMEAGDSLDIGSGEEFRTFVSSDFMSVEETMIQEDHETPETFRNVMIVATRAIFKGKGQWIFEYDGKTHPMAILDTEWKQRLANGEISINGRQEIRVDLLKKVITRKTMGRIIKRAVKFSILKVHDDTAA